MPATMRRHRRNAWRPARTRPPGTVSYREDHVAALRQLLREVLGVREGNMFGHPAFFVGRRMFACVYGEGVGLKLPAHRASELIEASIAAPFQPYGKPRMREWVQITRARSADYTADRDLLIEAISFVAGDRTNGRSP